MADVLDEFIDRFGEPPKECTALLKISLMRALASECRIAKVECREGNLVFSPERADLAVWSELFGRYKGLSFRAAGASPLVFYRLRAGESVLDIALNILKDYSKVLCEMKTEETANEQK